jgi:Ca2+-binding RTX toxin-like protein
VGVSVNLATGRGFGGTAEGDTYVSIENVYGSSFNDTITGNDGANELYGLDGNDRPARPATCGA